MEQWNPRSCEALYAGRFGTEGESAVLDLWEVLVLSTFSRSGCPRSVVVDVAAGHCEFINNIKRRPPDRGGPESRPVVRAAAGVETNDAAPTR